MRTTLTLDPDVARLVDDAVHRDRQSMKQVVNEALRRALTPAPATRPYRLEPHDSALRPGIDPAALNRLSDELETEAVVARQQRS
jgi:hypothetical protein